MVDEKREFRAALEQVRSGSPNAVWGFIEIYGPHIQRIVRRKLDRRMRSKFDSLDFVQMVWVSFFRNPREIRSFQEPEDLLRFLAAVARRKVISEYRRRICSRKYNVTREHSLALTAETFQRMASPDTTPSQIAMAREQWERMLGQQPSRDRTILQLRFDGVTFDEISRRLGIHERTARRVIDRLARRSQANA